MDKEQAERLIKALERIADCMGKEKRETGKLAAGATPFRSAVIVASESKKLDADIIATLTGSSDRAVSGGLRESGPA